MVFPLRVPLEAGGPGLLRRLQRVRRALQRPAAAAARLRPTTAAAGTRGPGGAAPGAGGTGGRGRDVGGSPYGVFREKERTE